MAAIIWPMGRITAEMAPATDYLALDSIKQNNATHSPPSSPPPPLPPMGVDATESSTRGTGEVDTALDLLPYEARGPPVDN